MPKELHNPLAPYGYNLVALPKEDIAPMMLLYRNGDSLGSLDESMDIFFEIGDSAPPEVIENKDVSGISGNTKFVYEAKAGISILDHLLQRLHMGKLAGKMGLDGNSTMTINYETVKEDKVSLLQLDNYISTARPAKIKFTTYREKLEDGELYVVNAVLKTNSFTVSVEDGNGQTVDIEATIKGILDAKTDFNRNKNNSITLKNATDTPLIFAFKAQQILYDKKAWWEFFRKDEARFRIKDQQGEILKGEDDFPTMPLKWDAPVDF